MNKRKLAVLFPGQGAYYNGVLTASYTLYPQVAEVFAEIDEVSKQEFGQTVADVLFRTPAHDTDNTLQHSPALLQFALYGVDVALYKILESHCLRPDTFIGHSFGEIAALVCAGAFTIREGAFIVAQRVKALQRVDTGNGYMAALGTDVTHARKLLDLLENKDTVIAVENHEGQTVISGTQEIMDTIGQVCQCLKITFTRLNSPYPFHSPLLQPAVSDFAAHISHLKQRPLHTPVYSPIMQRYYSPDDRFTTCLAQHLVLPLNFAEAVRSLHREGVQTFVECGALDILAKLTRKILRVGTQTGASPTPTAPAGEDVDIIVSLDPKQDEITSLEAMLKELERHGYVAAKSTVQRLADLVLPGVEQENFSAFWRVMGKQILARIKQDYETYMRGNATPASAQEVLISVPEEAPVQHTVVETEQRIVSHGMIQPEAVDGVTIKDRHQLFQEMSSMYAEMLEYPLEVFTEEIQLEAELGIDSIKQTELLARVSERYKLPPRPDNFRLSNHDTMGKVVDFAYSFLADTQQAQEPIAAQEVLKSGQATHVTQNGLYVPERAYAVDRDELFGEITTLYAEALEYPVEVFSDEIQLEAELGIDSIKQTELLARVRERYKLPPRSDNFRLSDYDTMGKVVDFACSMLKQSEQRVSSSLRDLAYA